MRTFEVESYDYLKRLDHGTSENDAFHPVFFGRLLQILRLIQIPAAGGLEVVAAIAVTRTKKDDMWYLGGATTIGWQMKAGTKVFNNNHIQFWLRNANGNAVLHIGNLFHESMAQSFMDNGAREELVRDTIVANLSNRLAHLRAEKREQVRTVIERLAEMHIEQSLIEDQS